MRYAAYDLLTTNRNREPALNQQQEQGWVGQKPPAGPWHERAKFFIKQTPKATQSDLADYLGIKVARLNHYLNGRRPASFKVIAKIAEYLRRDVRDLFDPGDEGLSEMLQVRDDSAFQNVDRPARPAIRDVPLISWVAAGQWADVVDNFHPGDAEDWVYTSKRVSNTSFALRVQGDSMTSPTGKSFPHGTFIIVDPDKPADNGALVVAKLPQDDAATFKQLSIEGDGRTYLKPLNPHYPIIEIKPGAELSICGVVVQAIIDT